MNTLSGMKISHKISSLMVGLIVGFVLMGVAYYAQISVDIKQASTNKQFQQSEQLLTKFEQLHLGYKDQLIASINSRNKEKTQLLEDFGIQLKLAAESLKNIDLRFYSSSDNEKVAVSHDAFMLAVDSYLNSTSSQVSTSPTIKPQVRSLVPQLNAYLQKDIASINLIAKADMQYAAYLSDGDQADVQGFSQTINELRTTIATADISAQDAKKAESLLNEYAQSFNEISAKRDGVNSEQATLEEASVDVLGSINGYREAMQDNLLRRIEAAAGEKRVAQWMFAVVLFLTATGTTLGLFLIYRSIVLPLWHMQSIIAQQNRGNDKARVKVTANDELGNLGRAFNRLLDERIQVLSEKFQENETLNNSIIGLIRALGMIAKKDLSIKVPVSADVTGTVSDAVNLLTSETARTLHQVKEFSEKINAISDQLQAQSTLVTAVAEEERMQVAETISALDQSVKTMTDIAREARVTNSIAGTAIESTLKAQSSVTQTVEGIQIIRSTISETEKRIKRLGDRSQEITSIVNLINTIAERTHILALNASMHAASAGEAGKGFAVVAEEVQRLAENARSATSEISSMVNNIRVETSDTVNTMNRLIAQVAEGTKLAENSGVLMHETEAATRQLVNHVKSIAVNSVNQANTMNKVRDRASSITDSTEKTYQALQEQHLQTEELKICAHSLVERVNVFTLPEFRADARNAVIAIRQPAVNEEHIENSVANA